MYVIEGYIESSPDPTESMLYVIIHRIMEKGPFMVNMLFTGATGQGRMNYPGIDWNILISILTQSTFSFRCIVVTLCSESTVYLGLESPGTGYFLRHRVHVPD